MTEKKSFLLYYSYRRQFDMMTDEQLGRLIRAFYAYEIDGEKSDLSDEPMLEMCFSFIAENLDNNKAEYSAQCARNSENGKKGGRPRKQKTEQEPQETEKTEQEPQKTEKTEQEPKETEKTEQKPQETEKTEGFSEKPKKADKDKDKDKGKDMDMDKGEDMDTGEGTDTGTEPALTRGSMPPAAGAPTPSARNRKKNKRREKPSVSEEGIIGEMRAEYGTALTEQYLRKVEDYCASTGKDYANKAAAARKWLREDVQNGKVVPPSKSSLCTDRFYSAANEFDPWEELKSLGASDEEMKRLGASDEELKRLGVSKKLDPREELKRRGTSREDMLRIIRSSH